MRNIFIQTVFLLAFFFIINGICFSQEIEIYPHVIELLNRELSKSLRQFPLDLENAQRIDQAFRSWVGRSIDFEKADARKSDRFEEQVTYY